MLTLDHKRKFLDIYSALSPENLTCDGELSRSQVERKHRRLMKEFRDLVAETGYEPSESEAYSWLPEIRAADQAERQKQLAAQPQHPLVSAKNPGVWSREGENGLSAYYIQNDKHRGPVMFNGINMLENAKDEYRLYSEFAQVLNGKEQIGTYATLGEAVDAAETFLKQVTRAAYKAARPLYRDENIDRELRRLPRA